eukprot:TRINITY_DN4210_c0_g2_i1.p1 TRINITY_DN4210_c0_g2~~TRINITY_DN4210_c0_g2_i1.p1  ORF type:complete len:693 (-),score=114.69 TRINITY_DN4210_c0_g2_i1:262-2340(-)
MESPALTPEQRQFLLAFARPAILLVLLFLLALCCLGPGMMLPGEKGFALYACWVAGITGGKLFGCGHQPPLLGMLIAGIVLRNTSSIVEPLPEAWSAAVRVFGLSVILMRSGLELDLAGLWKIGAACGRLTVLPGCCEALTVGIVSMLMFGMPFPLALALGFILAAVSPAVVVGGMFDLQRRGYGVAKGIPSLVVAAASFDDVVAITGYSLCIGFAIVEEGQNLLWEAMHGPINVGLGIALGIVGGLLTSQVEIWNTPLKRTVGVALVGLMMAFACSRFHFTGAGALASLVTTCVAARQWGKLAAQKQQETCTEDQAKDAEADELEAEDPQAVSDEDATEPDEAAFYAHEVEAHLAILWSNVAQPLLFCVIGSALNFAELDARTIPASIFIVLCGVCVRCPVASLATMGAGLEAKERLFVGLAWIPKATVQAALGGIPLDIVRTTLDPDEESYHQYEKWGLAILTTAVFSILITAPIGLLVIQNLGHRWLHYDGVAVEDDLEEGDEPATIPADEKQHGLVSAKAQANQACQDKLYDEASNTHCYGKDASKWIDLDDIDVAGGVSAAEETPSEPSTGLGSYDRDRVIHESPPSTGSCASQNHCHKQEITVPSHVASGRGRPAHLSENPRRSTEGASDGDRHTSRGHSGSHGSSSRRGRSRDRAHGGLFQQVGSVFICGRACEPGSNNPARFRA